LKNAQHSYKLILDIGNSQTKYHLITNTNFTLYSLSALKERLLGLEQIDIYVLSTVPERVSSSVAELTSALAGIIKINNIFKNNIDNTWLEGSYLGLGADRIVKLCGALTLYHNYSVILFDFGTATTMSLGCKAPSADSRGVFKGGFIASGLKTSIKALNQNCSLLDDFSEQDLAELISEIEAKPVAQRFFSTREQIIYGAYQAHLGLIGRWLEQASEIFKTDNQKLIKLATGGEAKIFAPGLFDEYIESSVLLDRFFGEYVDRQNRNAN